jgi:hypothetical protein
MGITIQSIMGLQADATALSVAVTAYLGQETKDAKALAVIDAAKKLAGDLGITI